MVSRHHTLLTYATIHVCAAITSFYFWWQGEHQWTLVQLTCRYTMVHVHLSQSIIMYNVCKKNNKKAGIHQNQLTQTFHQNHNHVQSYSLNMISHFQKKNCHMCKSWYTPWIPTSNSGVCLYMVARERPHLLAPYCKTPVLNLLRMEGKNNDRGILIYQCNYNTLESVMNKDSLFTSCSTTGAYSYNVRTCIRTSTCTLYASIETSNE